MTKTQQLQKSAAILAESNNGRTYSNIRWAGHGGWRADYQDQRSSFGMPEWITTMLGADFTNAQETLAAEIAEAKYYDELS